MAKNFNTESVTGKFFKHDTQDTYNTQSTPDTHNTQDTHNKQKKYRYNLNLDLDLKPYLQDIAWQERTSVTQYINNLIRQDMEKYLAAGGSKEGWKNYE